MPILWSGDLDDDFSEDPLDDCNYSMGDGDDLEGAEELLMERGDVEVHIIHGLGADEDFPAIARSKRNLLIALVGFILIMGWLWVAISREVR